MSMSDHEILLLVCCILLPPLGVFLKNKEVDIHLVINIVLCCFFWLPGILHALWYCFMR